MTDNTLLLRQVHPSFVQNGRVTSQAFRPTPKDEEKLSTYDGDMISADESWEHFTSSTGCISHGVMGISVFECTVNELTIIEDRTPFDEHISIDFSGFTKKENEKKSKKLKAKAQSRDWLHLAD